MSCQEPDGMATPRWIAGIHAWIIVTTIALIVICPALAVPITETHDISKDIMTVSMGPVVSGTNQNSTVIRIVSDNPCTPSLRYANESFFSVSKDYDRDVPGVPKGTYHAIQITGLEPATKYHYLASGCGIPDIDRTFTTFP